MYPAFVEAARAEGARPAELAFAGALEAEKVHKALYEEALEAVRAGRDIDAARYFTCSICGYTHKGDGPPEKCPVCGASPARFREVQ